MIKIKAGYSEEKRETTMNSEEHYKRSYGGVLYKHNKSPEGN